MKNIVLGIGIGLICSALLGAGNTATNKSQLDILEQQVLIETLLKEAAEELKMEPPKPATKNYPKLTITEKTMVEWVICKNVGCSALAASVENFIFVAKQVDLRSTEGQGIMYHELIHALQYAKYGQSPNCQEWVRREHEAYVLQDKWVSARGLEIPWLTQVHDKLEGYCRDYSKKR